MGPSTSDSDSTAPTVAITGAAGYIGSRVLSDLQTAHPGWAFVPIDNQYRGQVTSVGDIEIDHVDIRNRERLESVLDGVDVVCHLAAISGVEDCDENPDLAYEVNVTGTNNVAWFCRKTGAALVFPYSMAVVGDPTTFPITASHPRNPLNWYGTTKYISEQSITAFATEAFPAYTFLIANLYGEHVVDGSIISKSSVLNFFVDRAVAGETLTVYNPGTQARNFVHVKDVAAALVAGIEQLVDADDSGVTTYEIGSNEDPSVMDTARQVQRIASKEYDYDVDIELIENPRSGETMVESFDVDYSRAVDDLDWAPTHTVESTVRDLLSRRV